MSPTTKWTAAVLMALGIVLSTTASAGPVRGPVQLLLESDADAPLGQELFSARYPDGASFAANTNSSTRFLPTDLNAGFSTAGLANDSNGYHLLLESDADALGGAELFLASYGSEDDFLNNVGASTRFLNQDINPVFSTHGFTFDGGQYHLLLESDADEDRGSELFLASYDSFADLLNNAVSNSQFLAVDLNRAFSVAGFDFDGLSYQLLLESNLDAALGAELFLVTFASLSNLILGVASNSQFLPTDLNPLFSARGLTTAVQYIVDPTPVPTPARCW